MCTTCHHDASENQRPGDQSHEDQDHQDLTGLAQGSPTTGGAAPSGPESSRTVNRRAVLSGVGGVVGAVIGNATIFGGAQPAAAAVPPQHEAPGHRSSRDSHLQLVLLGTKAGPPVNYWRKGIASALVVDGSIYVVDCGRSALTQFSLAGLPLASLRAIFLTHLHIDHLADYFNFFLLGGVPSLQGDGLPSHIDVYGPGPAGGLPAKFGGGAAPTVNPTNPTPGIVDLHNSCMDAYAYSTNLFLRDSGIRDPRSLATVHQIGVPTEVGASYQNAAPTMDPFVVMQDDKVKVTAILVPHGPVFPAFAFRFDTAYGSVTFSGDTTYTSNIPTLAKDTDLLVHEAINLEGFAGSPALASHARLSHVDVQRVGTVAAAANARHLVLSHVGDYVSDLIDVRRWTNWAQQGYDGRVTVGQDLQRFCR